MDELDIARRVIDERDKRIEELERLVSQGITDEHKVRCENIELERRLQIMREWMQQNGIAMHGQYWDHFREDNPEAADWFDEEGK